MPITSPRVVRDIMTTNVVTLREEDDLSQVQDALQFFEFRHVPVVDGERVVGVVSMTDLLRLAASSRQRDGEVRTRQMESYLFASEVMTKEVRTVSPDTPLARAAEMLRFHKIDCLPVVEDDDRLVGIVTTTDFLTLAVHLLEGPPSPE